MSEAPKITQERLREIYDECGGDAGLIREKLGLTQLELATVTTASLMPPRRRQPPHDVGKNYFRSYIVSVRHAEHATWPREDESKIEDARMKYEAGTHTICQGRDRDWFVLYCVPLSQRVGARKFFRAHD